MPVNDAVDAAGTPVGAAGVVPRGDAASDVRRLVTLSLASLGVVYGDIGTSPLYALRECFSGAHAVPVTRVNVLGVLSLIFWALVLFISVKYLVLALRAENRGEGGILALMALAHSAPLGPRGGSRRIVVALGLFGAALLYGDGVITPAISVLSAVEGLKVGAPGLAAYVVPLTLLILVALFLAQRRGTAGIGAIFGPVMAGHAGTAPPALVQGVEHNKSLHETVVLVTLLTEEVPHVAATDRVEVRSLDHGFWVVTGRYGFMQDPNVLEVLGRCRAHGLEIDAHGATFFLGRETVLATRRPGMARWREKLFAFMSRNALRATAYFRIPADRVFEVGVQVEL